MAVRGVIHHYPAGRGAEAGTLSHEVPRGTRIVSAAWRHASGAPVVYVEKVEEDAAHPGAPQRLEAFFVGTGHAFDARHGLDFIATVTPDGVFFFHVYARIF